MKRAMLLAAFLLFFSRVATGSAQDETPAPGPDAATHLPDSALLGEGWSLSSTVSPDGLSRYGFKMSPDVFREGAAAVFVGPRGSRVVAISLLLTENRVAIRKSWEDAGELVRYVMYDVSQPYGRASELESMDPPDGCAEAARAEGIEGIVLLPAASTTCAVDPDGILIAAVFGTLGDETGVVAADRVIEVMLASGSASGTPAA
jgi:hypothetical protein